MRRAGCAVSPTVRCLAIWEAHARPPASPSRLFVGWSEVICHHLCAHALLLVAGLGSPLFRCIGYLLLLCLLLQADERMRAEKGLQPAPAIELYLQFSDLGPWCGMPVYPTRARYAPRSRSPGPYLGSTASVMGQFIPQRAASMTDFHQGCIGSRAVHRGHLASPPCAQVKWEGQMMIVAILQAVPPSSRKTGR